MRTHEQRLVVRGVAVALAAEQVLASERFQVELVLRAGVRGSSARGGWVRRAVASSLLLFHERAERMAGSNGPSNASFHSEKPPPACVQELGCAHVSEEGGQRLARAHPTALLYECTAAADGSRTATT